MLTLTYDDLVSDMRSWAEDDDADYIAEIDGMIARAESRVLRDLDLEEFEHFLEVSIASGNRVVTTSGQDILHVNELWIRDPVALKWIECPRRSFGYCLMYAPTESTNGVPAYFAINDEEELYVVPTPDQAYAAGNAKVRATIRPTAMSSGNQNTWLGTFAADLLFQACMIEAYDYLKNPAKLKEAADKYTSLIPGFSKVIEEQIRRRYKALNTQRQGADN